MKKEKIKVGISLIIIFLILSVIYVWSLARLKMILGSGDMAFQANRIEELYQDATRGTFVPRISVYSFNQVGSGVSFFYPWILLYPFVFFQILTKNPIIAFYLFIILETFVTFSIAYYSMYRFSSSQIRSFAFCCLYTLANYRLYLVFNQNVLAESIAFSFMPLAFLGFYETFFRDVNKWYLLSLGMTMLIYSHMLTTTLTATFFLVTLLMLWPKIDKKMIRLLSAVKAGIVSFLLSAFFLIPFVEQALKNNLTASWVGFQLIKSPSETIDSSLNNEPTQVVGLLLIITLLFGFIWFKQMNGEDKFAYVSGVVLVILTTTIMPWPKLLGTPLDNLQFPYRLNGIATLLLAVYLSRIIELMINERYRHSSFQKIIFIFWVAFVPLFLTYSAEQNIISSRVGIPKLSKRSTIRHYYLGMNSGSYNLSKKDWQNMFYYYGHNGSFDYFPQSVNKNNVTDIVTHKAFLNGRKQDFNDRRSTKPNQIIYDLSGIKKGTTVELPILYYENDVVKVGNRSYQKPSVTNRNTIRVTVPSSHKMVSVKYQNSILDTISIIVSVLTWIFMVVVYPIMKLRGRKNDTVY